MKIRIGFVSNSSSASFVVSLDKISAKDALRLMAYREQPEDTSGRTWKDHWNMTVDYDRGVIIGFASMDNEDLGEYLTKHGVDASIFIWDGD